MKNRPRPLNDARKKTLSGRQGKKESVNKVIEFHRIHRDLRLISSLAERRAAEKRQKAKIENKRAQAEASRLKAEKAIRDRHEHAQRLRSAVFAAARSGDAAKVKQGIWEDEVDAAGGEIKSGCETFIQAPKDAKETLLHIAVKNGDAELVAWLDAHSRVLMLL